MRRIIKALPAIAAIPLAVFAALGSTVPSGASVLGHRPAAASVAGTGFSGFTNTFTKGHGNFCDNPADAACDGNAGAGHYGTANRVDATFNNGGTGNYAAGTLPLLPNGATNLADHMVIDGSTAANQGNPCPTGGTEGCTGPYMEKAPGGVNAQTTFPANGYTVTSYQYIDPSYSGTAGSANGAAGQVDTDLGITKVDNTTTPPTASYGSDNVITACNDSGGTSLSFGHGSPGACGSGDEITQAGWYRFVFLVNETGGDVTIDARVLSEDGSTVLFNSGAQPVDFGSGQVTTAQAGGLRYLWWPTLNVDGLPVGYVNYSSGQQLSGHAS